MTAYLTTKSLSSKGRVLILFPSKSPDSKVSFQYQTNEKINVVTIAGKESGSMIL